MSAGSPARDHRHAVPAHAELDALAWDLVAALAGSQPPSAGTGTFCWYDDEDGHPMVRSLPLLRVDRASRQLVTSGAPRDLMLASLGLDPRASWTFSDPARQLQAQFVGTAITHRLPVDPAGSSNGPAGSVVSVILRVRALNVGHRVAGEWCHRQIDYGADTP